MSGRWAVDGDRHGGAIWNERTEAIGRVWVCGCREPLRVCLPPCRVMCFTCHDHSARRRCLFVFRLLVAACGRENADRKFSLFGRYYKKIGRQHRGQQLQLATSCYQVRSIATAYTYTHTYTHYTLHTTTHYNQRDNVYNRLWTTTTPTTKRDTLVTTTPTLTINNLC